MKKINLKFNGEELSIIFYSTIAIFAASKQIYEILKQKINNK